MTWYSSKDVAYVFLGTESIAGSINSLRMKTSAKLADTTGLGDTWREMSDTGLREGELEFSGLYTPETWTTYMNAVSDTNRVVSVLLEGNEVSKRFYGFAATTMSGVEIGISPDSVHTSSPTVNVRGPVNFGYVVAPRAARTTAGNTQTTYADMGAASTTARAYLHVTNLTLGGYTNLVVTVQSCDTSGGTYDDETAFTAATGATYESVALSGTVNRYLAVKWAWTGAGTGQSATFFVGVAP